MIRIIKHSACCVYTYTFTYSLYHRRFTLFSIFVLYENLCSTEGKEIITKSFSILLHFLFKRPHGVYDNLDQTKTKIRIARSLQLNSNNEDVKLMKRFYSTEY